jgi:hypothetical protein
MDSSSACFCSTCCYILFREHNARRLLSFGDENAGMQTCKLQSSATSSRAWQRCDAERHGGRGTNATGPNLQETSKALRIWRVVDHPDGHEALEQQVRAPSVRRYSDLMYVWWRESGSTC